MFSLICVYNNEQILKELFLKGLENPGDYQLTLIDNTQGRFTSAAQAFNSVRGQIQHDYILFAHQDFRFCSSDFLERIEYYAKTLPGFGVLGFAGRSKMHGYQVVSKISHGQPSQNVGISDFDKPIEVQTVDECCFIISKQNFENYPFDEGTASGWHLYTVDYCLTMIKNKKSNYILPLSAYHRSLGVPLPENYFNDLKKVLNKHQGDLDTVYTSCGIWNAHIPVPIQRVYTAIRIYLGRIKKLI